MFYGNKWFFIAIAAVVIVTTITPVAERMNKENQLTKDRIEERRQVNECKSDCIKAVVHPRTVEQCNTLCK